MLHVFWSWLFGRHKVEALRDNPMASVLFMMSSSNEVLLKDLLPLSKNSFASFGSPSGPLA